VQQALVFLLAALLSMVMVIGAQQPPPLIVSSTSPSTLDDLETAEQDFVNPLGREAFRNLALGGFFDQYGAGKGNDQTSKIYLPNLKLFLVEKYDKIIK